MSLRRFFDVYTDNRVVVIAGLRLVKMDVFETFWIEVKGLSM